MILTFELEPELEKILEKDAQQKQVSTSEMVKNFLVQNYFNQHQATQIQQVMGHENISPITQSLIGLLANSNLDEFDYKKHLEDKYL